MADILIRGMEMPQEGFVEILIRDDGTVQQTGKSYRIDGTDYYTPYIGEIPVMYEAVPVTPHGDLIDRDKLITHFCTHCCVDRSLCDVDNGKQCCEVEFIKIAPTVIPADKDCET